VIEFVLWFFLWFHLHGLGITIGYHRLATHRSAVCNKFLFYTLIWFGYTSLQGGVISWAGVHRLHHIGVDTPKDPHSPSQRGFLYALQGWVWLGKNPNCDALVPWLMKDPVLRFFGHGKLPSKPLLNISTCMLWRVLLYFCFGLNCALASILAGALIYLAPHLINTLCHMPQFGYRNYPTKDLSTNIPWLNILNFGEAYHNNPHFAPSRPFQGEINRGEVDTSYLFMLLFRKLGLMKF
jgi:stearoyl-CoA desaturase (delta-9 desaturase)